MAKKKERRNRMNTSYFSKKFIIVMTKLKNTPKKMAYSPIFGVRSFSSYSNFLKKIYYSHDEIEWIPQKKRLLPNFGVRSILPYTVMLINQTRKIGEYKIKNEEIQKKNCCQGNEIYKTKAKKFGLKTYRKAFIINQDK